MPKQDYPLNQFQRIAAMTYGCGDYAYFAYDRDAAEAWKDSGYDSKAVGDTLFRFIMIELSDREADTPVDGMQESDAERRMENAVRDIRDVIRGLGHCQGQEGGKRFHKMLAKSFGWKFDVGFLGGKWYRPSNGDELKFTKGEDKFQFADSATEACQIDKLIGGDDD